MVKNEVVLTTIKDTDDTKLLKMREQFKRGDRIKLYCLGERMENIY